MTDGSGYARVRVSNGDGDGAVVEFPAPDASFGTVPLVLDAGEPVVVRLHADGSGELVRIDPADHPEGRQP